MSRCPAAAPVAPAAAVHPGPAQAQVILPSRLAQELRQVNGRRHSGTRLRRHCSQAATATPRQCATRRSQAFAGQAHDAATGNHRPILGNTEFDAFWMILSILSAACKACARSRASGASHSSADKHSSATVTVLPTRWMRAATRRRGRRTADLVALAQRSTRVAWCATSGGRSTSAPTARAWGSRNGLSSDYYFTRPRGDIMASLHPPSAISAGRPSISNCPASTVCATA